MSKIRAVIFDDEEDDLDEIDLSLRNSWERYRLPNGDGLPNLEITKILAVKEMTSFLLRNDLSEFHFFISDLLVGASQSQDGKTAAGGMPERKGFQFLKRAKEKGIRVCISLTHGKWNHDDFSKGIESFGSSIDLHLLKADFYGSNGDRPRENLIQNIVQKLQEKGLLQALSPHLVMEDGIQESRTQAMLDEVGQSTLNSLASIFSLEGCTSYSARSIAPGLSGSKIILMEYAGREDFGDRPIIAKLNRDRMPLQRELDAFKEYIQKPRHLVAEVIAKPTANELVQVNGWHALAFTCVRKARSLSDWLIASPSDSVKPLGILEELYKHNGLTGLYRASKQEKGHLVEQVRADLLSPYRKMAIQEAIAELSPLIKQFWTGQAWRESFVTGLLENGSVGSIANGSLKWTVATTICHGDFHSRNILVQTADAHPKLCVIDLASMKRSFWATDAVRLSADLALTCLDSGPKSYDWSNINEWGSILDILLNGKLPPGTSQETASVLQVTLAWLRDKVFENHAMDQSKHLSGEYALALAVELMRNSYRKLDLPAPKRGFALIGAAIAIEAAERLFMENRGR